MESLRDTRILVVANRTAATPRLLEAVRRRATDGSCEFALLIPPGTSSHAADWTLDSALPLMRQAAGGNVRGLIAGLDAFQSIKDAVHRGDFDEIIVSTRPGRMSKWLRRDLIWRVKGLGLPVTSIVPSAKLPREDQIRIGVGAGQL